MSQRTLITETTVNQTLAIETYNDIFQSCFKLHLAYQRSRNHEMALAQLPKLQYYARILGFNMQEYLDRHNFSKYLLETTSPLPQITPEIANTVLETVSETVLNVLEKPNKPFENPNNVGLNGLKPLKPSEKSNGICLYCQKQIKNPRSNKFFCDGVCRSTYNNEKK